MAYFSIQYISAEYVVKDLQLSYLECPDSFWTGATSLTVSPSSVRSVKPSGTLYMNACNSEFLVQTAMVFFVPCRHPILMLLKSRRMGTCEQSERWQNHAF